MGLWFTLWTVRVSMVLYAASLALRRRFDVARVLWTAGCLLLWVHVGLALHYVHHWDHAHVVSETARQTFEATGWLSGAGVYFNYATMLVWAGDAAYWWLAGHGRYFARGRWVALSVHLFLLFMAFNATVVFARGATRWVAAGVCVVLVVAVAFSRRQSK
jgi:hypothetical protein